MGNLCGSGLKHFEEQEYKKIKKDLLSNEEKFVDDKFDSSNHTLPGGSQDAVWLRPHEICEKLRGSDKEQFGVPEMGPRKSKSINQGEIGDCWFISPLTGLVENKHLFDKVFPPGQNFKNNYCGLFRFHFYRLGEWYEVVIDDRLPTRAGHLIFLRGNHPNEFWPALFEKAYAKFNGGYSKIEGGNSIDAGVDFTGGISERLDVEDYIRTKGQGPEKLHHLLKLSNDNGALISCTLGGHYQQEAVNQKLQNRHAYTLTGMTKVRGGRNGCLVIPLIRLRDPHGMGIQREWDGDWGDDSELWSEIPSRMEKRLRKMEKDGEFYISYNKDFLRYFNDIDLIHLNPIRIELNEDRHTRKFNLAEFRDEWPRGVAGATTNERGYQNFHKNPQFRFSVSNCRDKSSTCTVVVSLLQELDNQKSVKPGIGFIIYKNIPSESIDERFAKNADNIHCKSGAFIDARDVSKPFLLPAGSYCIIPSTYNAEDFGKFYLRLFVDNRWNCDANVPLSTVRDYTASARASQRCRSFWRTLFCCQCYCCCPTSCLPTCCCGPLSCAPCSTNKNNADQYRPVQMKILN